EIAGIRPSHVHHYLGSRQEMLEAAVERALANVETLVIDALESTPLEQRLSAQLDIIFSREIAAPEVNQLIDQLLAASYHHPTIRTAMKAMYLRFADVIQRSVAAAYPRADPEKSREVAHAILELAHASASFAWLGFEPNNLDYSRAAAQELLRRLSD
ncbi:MAG: TetR/AcrR family transcriptional regulator, partial [Acidimicrobiales bacterium]